MNLAAIDTGQLLQVVWVSLLAGIGVTLAFSVVVYAGSRSAEARRTGLKAPATLFGILAMVALAAFVAGVVLGVSIMLDKG